MDKLMKYAAPVILTVAAVLVVVAVVNRNNNTGLTSQTYTRTIACLASESPIKRTPDYVKQCYDESEKATGTKVDRYGNGR